MINDNLELTGALTISINNNVVQDTDNLVVTVGRQWVSNRLRDAVSATTAGAFVVGVSHYRNSRFNRLYSYWRFC